MPSSVLSPRNTCLCGESSFEWKASFDAPPKGEPKYFSSSSTDYYREIHRCRSCGHFIALHKMDLSEMYESDWVQSTYGGIAGIKTRFDKVNSLPQGQSDNVARAERVHGFASEILVESLPRNMLDIGAGIGVFVYRMKERGWECTAVDKDARLMEHISSSVEVSVHCGDFRELKASPFSLITLNKVLEHVSDPRSFLADTKKFLHPEGFVYIEVPDGEAASSVGFDREEFFVDHLHVFSNSSLRFLAESSGYHVKEIESLREPSGKYTLRAFLGF